MIKYKTIMVAQQIMKEYSCDKCKKIIVDDDMQLQEAFSINFVGGFASIFGDGNTVSCDLCQKCLYEMISDYCIYNGEGNDGTGMAYN